MSTFQRLAAAACPPHEDLALGLAAELGSSATPEDMCLLGDLAGELSAAELDPPLVQLDALAKLLEEEITIARDGPLLLPEVLRGGGASPDAAAVLGACVAHRAGLRIAVAGRGADLVLAHRDALLVVDPARLGPSPLLARELGMSLAWRCAHEATMSIIGQLTVRAERSGDLAGALASSALALALPLGHDTRRRCEERHRRLASRLN